MFRNVCLLNSVSVLKGILLLFSVLSTGCVIKSSIKGVSA